MRTIGHVTAVPADRDTATEIVEDLAAHGIHARLESPVPGTYPLEDTSLRQHVRGAERGLALGLGLGALAGVLVVALIGAVRDLGWPTQLLLVAGIALQGTIPAIMWGMGRTDRDDDDPVDTTEVTDHDRLIVVDAPQDEIRARRVLEHHDVVFVVDEAVPTSNA